MIALQSEGVRFSIAPCGDAWSWETFDRQGRPRDRGMAGSKREAAAWVIRHIILGCLPIVEAESERLAA